jgi:hypothetical protein
LGNNVTYSTFQHTVITLYNHGVLTVDLLDELAKEYEGTDIDSGGDTGLLTKDGKTLEEVCIGLIDPAWIPERSENDEDYMDPAEWEDEERYYKWERITDGRWGWK